MILIHFRLSAHISKIHIHIIHLIRLNVSSFIFRTISYLFFFYSFLSISSPFSMELDLCVIFHNMHKFTHYNNFIAGFFIYFSVFVLFYLAQYYDCRFFHFSSSSSSSSSSIHIWITINHILLQIYAFISNLFCFCSVWVFIFFYCYLIHLLLFSDFSVFVWWFLFADLLCDLMVYSSYYETIIWGALASTANVASTVNNVNTIKQNL